MPLPTDQRTAVLAAGAALSVLIFLGVAGYALTQRWAPLPSPQGPADVPVVSGSGQFTGRIAGMRGDQWTFTLSGGTAMTVRVTDRTELTPQAQLVGKPGFVAGQTVSVFWHDAGRAAVADHIYGIGN
jgi:hypothetical protein